MLLALSSCFRTSTYTPGLYYFHQNILLPCKLHFTEEKFCFLHYLSKSLGIMYINSMDQSMLLSFYSASKNCSWFWYHNWPHKWGDVLFLETRGKERESYRTYRTWRVNGRVIKKKKKVTYRDVFQSRLNNAVFLCNILLGLLEKWSF